MCELDETAINAAILSYRKLLAEAKTEEEQLIACCYVDAYQRVRLMHDLGALPQTQPGVDGRYA